MLEVLGADVRPVPAVPFDNPDNYNHQVLLIGCKEPIAFVWMQVMKFGAEHRLVDDF